MLLSLKPYKQYKDFGGLWLEKVPNHWEVARLGALLQERGEVNAKGEVNKVLSVLRGRGVVPYKEKGNIGNKMSENITRYKIVYPGDIVLNSMNVIIGSVGISPYHGCLSPVYYVLFPRHREDVSAYLNAYFQTKPFQQSLTRLGNGILAHRMRIPMELLKSEPFPRPPAKEQRAIVKFLDWAERRMRFIIAAWKRRIQLLEEYRQALINDAVTGKFDVRTGKPYPSYKDSGVPWLGKVPESWQILPVKRAFDIRLGKMLQPQPKDDNDLPVPYLKAKHVQWFHVETNDLPKMWASPKEIAMYSIAPGDLLVCEGGEGGRCAIANNIDGTVIIQNSLHRVRGKDGNSNVFLGYLLRAISYTGWFDLLMDKAPYPISLAKNLQHLKSPSHLSPNNAPLPST